MAVNRNACIPFLQLRARKGPWKLAESQKGSRNGSFIFRTLQKILMFSREIRVSEKARRHQIIKSSIFCVHDMLQKEQGWSQMLWSRKRNQLDALKCGCNTINAIIISHALMARTSSIYISIWWISQLILNWYMFYDLCAYDHFDTLE